MPYVLRHHVVAGAAGVMGGAGVMGVERGYETNPAPFLE